MDEKHLEGLNAVEKRLVKAYATTILGNVHTLDDVRPDKLRSYVELEIAMREIAALVPEGE